MPAPFRHERPPVQAMVRSWEAKGCSPAVAGNLTAIELGIEPTSKGWSERELSRLLFLAERAVELTQ